MDSKKQAGENISPKEIKDRIKKIRESKEKKIDTKFVRSLSIVTSLGITMVIAIFIGMGLGVFLKEKFNNDLFLPLGLFIGVAIGGYLVYNLLKPLLK